MTMHYEIEGRSFALMSCGECGIAFLMPSDFERERHKDPKNQWSCPNGHVRVYRESEADALRRERDRLKQDAARLEGERLKALADRDKAQAETRRLRNRIGKGVCPCCNRSFSNVAKHMATKHPDVTPLRKPA